jgi:DNA invertase Pin-like site-specific DNA recombinase
MTTIAYLYTNPVLETARNPSIWGLEVDRVYQDIGTRQQLQQLIRDCQENPPNYLLIHCLDELGDTVSQIMDTLSLIESFGVEIMAIDQDYNSSAFKKANYQDIKLSIAKIWHEVEQNSRSRSLRQGHALNRLKVLPPPGKAPYGYRRSKDRYLIDKSTAPVVRDFFERFLLFASLRDAVRYLERKYGKKIAVSTARHWLTSPVYRGDLGYKNKQIIPNTHVAIISRQEAAQVDRLLRRNGSFSRRSASAPRCLAGLVFCGNCQTKMRITSVTRHNKKSEYLYLTPLNCSQTKRCKSLNYNQVLRQTIKQICRELPLAIAQQNFPSSEALTNKLQLQINQKQDLIKKLKELVKQNILDEETATIRSQKLSNEIAKLQEKITQLPPVNLTAIASTISLEQFWLDLSESERRFYLREFIKKIEVNNTHQNHPEKWELKLIFIF